MHACKGENNSSLALAVTRKREIIAKKTLPLFFFNIASYNFNFWIFIPSYKFYSVIYIQVPGPLNWISRREVLLVWHVLNMNWTHWHDIAAFFFLFRPSGIRKYIDHWLELVKFGMTGHDTKKWYPYRCFWVANKSCNTGIAPNKLYKYKNKFYNKKLLDKF